MMNNPASAQLGTQSQPDDQSTTVRYPVYLNANPKKTYNILKFSTPVDFSQWKEVTASRDLSKKKAMESFSSRADEMPEYGAGSEYGRKARDEAWRRKRGMNTGRKVCVKDLPIKFKVSKNKQYIGKKEGGVDEHSSYFIMSLNPPVQNSQSHSTPSSTTDATSAGSFQLLPVNAWFSATTAVSYKTLDDEEAEEQFSRRDKILNHFSLMLQKRLKDEQAEDEESNNGANNSSNSQGANPFGKMNPMEMGLSSMVQASKSAMNESNLLASLGKGSGSDNKHSKVYYKNLIKQNTAAAFKISDYDDDFMSSSEEDDNSSGGEGGGGDKKSKKKKKKGVDEDIDEKPKVVGGKKKQKNSDVNNDPEENEEIEEESDDGEFEGLELDYNEAESSPSEEEADEEDDQRADDNKAVPEDFDNAIGDNDDEEEEDEEERDANKNDDDKNEDASINTLSSKNKKGKKKKIGGLSNTSSPNESSDEGNDSSSDEDPDQVKSFLFLGGGKDEPSGNDRTDGSPSQPQSSDVASSQSGATSAGGLTEKQLKTAAVLSSANKAANDQTPSTPSTSSGKRKAANSPSLSGSSNKDGAKKSKLDNANKQTSGDPMEELIKKYCRRKATSTSELLQKVRKLKPELDKIELAQLMVKTMGKLGVASKTVNGKTLWYIKS